MPTKQGCSIFLCHHSQCLRRMNDFIGITCAPRYKLMLYFSAFCLFIVLCHGAWRIGQKAVLKLERGNKKRSTSFAKGIERLESLLTTVALSQGDSVGGPKRSATRTTAFKAREMGSETSTMNATRKSWPVSHFLKRVYGGVSSVCGHVSISHDSIIASK